MEPRITMLTLGVRDLARSAAFYRDGLSWAAADLGTDETVWFKMGGGVVLSLYARERLAGDADLSPEGSGFPGIALAHNVREREEVDQVLAHAAAAGARIVKPGHEIFWGGYVGFFQDPDGFLWEVAWNPGAPIGPDGNMVVPGEQPAP